MDLAWHAPEASKASEASSFVEPVAVLGSRGLKEPTGPARRSFIRAISWLHPARRQADSLRTCILFFLVSPVQACIHGQRNYDTFVLAIPYRPRSRRSFKTCQRLVHCSCDCGNIVQAAAASTPLGATRQHWSNNTTIIPSLQTRDFAHTMRTWLTSESRSAVYRVSFSH